ncbi:MAG: flavodoxin family protein, partial [Planctomycetota bacterium]
CGNNPSIKEETREQQLQAEPLPLTTCIARGFLHRTEVKALIDRAGLVSIANGRTLARKVGAAVVAVRRAGAVTTFDAINKFFLINRMIVPGSVYWNLGIGLGEGEVEGDDEGMDTMRALGENMAWLLGKIGRA